VEYLVTAEDTPYFHWQLELLIESFKLRNLQDKLVVALAYDPYPKYPDFRRNLNTHSRVIRFDNMGRKRGYPFLNKQYGTVIAVQNGAIRQPFTLIEPDMLLHKPVPEPTENIGFQVRPLFTREHVESNGIRVEPYIKSALWLPIGATYIFNGVGNDVFERATAYAEAVALDYAKASSEQPVKYWRYIERVGWELSFLSFYGGSMTYKGFYSLEMSLLDHKLEHCFVHYNNGLPPDFTKVLYRYDPPEFFGGGNFPFGSFLGDNPTSVTHFAQHVARKYLGLD
jgi:hypothetical protein